MSEMMCHSMVGAGQVSNIIHSPSTYGSKERIAPFVMHPFFLANRSEEGCLEFGRQQKRHGPCTDSVSSAGMPAPGALSPPVHVRGGIKSLVCTISCWRVIDSSDCALCTQTSHNSRSKSPPTMVPILHSNGTFSAGVCVRVASWHCWA